MSNSQGVEMWREEVEWEDGGEGKVVPVGWRGQKSWKRHVKTRYI